MDTCELCNFHYLPIVLSLCAVQKGCQDISLKLHLKPIYKKIDRGISSYNIIFYVYQNRLVTQFLLPVSNATAGDRQPT